MSQSTDDFDAKFDQYWSGQSITSLRRVQALYGAIEESQSSYESVIPEEFQLYVTPGELEGFTTEQDEENRLVTIKIDLTDASPQLDGIDVGPFRPEMVDRLGFSRFPWGRGIDHSITRRGAKGGSTRGTVSTYCVDCLERWTNADGREAAIGRVANEHPDGSIIQSLQSLGLEDGIEEEIEQELWSHFGEDEKPRVVATVAIQLDPDSLEEKPSGDIINGYYYPGQLHVLNAAMRARKEEKLAEKNSDIPSRGDGTCLVTNRSTEVFGTVDDPLAFFTVQHAEKFPELKKKNAWRAHPVSSEAALLMQSGASLFEQCRRTRHGRSIYTVPYFTQTDSHCAKILRHVVTATHKSSEESLMAEIQREIEREGDDDILENLRYYVIAIRNDSGDINVLHEVPDATIQPVRALAESHLDVLFGSTFNAVAGFRQPKNWQPISEGTDSIDPIINSITSGFYTFGTLARPDEDDPSTDDPSEWLTFSLLTGQQITANRLLSEYVERLAQERAKDSDGRVSEKHLKAQYTQLEALARADQLTAPEHPELTKPPRMTTKPDIPAAEQFLTDDGEIPIATVQEYRLKRFIEERPALDDNAQRRGAFLAGVLVGQLGNYQSSPSKRDMNRTVLIQYPAEQMSGPRITRFVPDLIQKTHVYASEDKYSGSSLFPELEDRLPETLADAAAQGWTLPIDDLRFHYALGQMYGKRALSRALDLRSSIADHAGIDLKTN